MGLNIGAGSIEHSGEKRGSRHTHQNRSRFGSRCHQPVGDGVDDARGLDQWCLLRPEGASEQPQHGGEACFWINGTQATENSRFTEREQARGGAQQPGDQRRAAVGDVKNEVASPRQRHEPRLSQRPGHKTGRYSRLNGPAIEKTCSEILVVRKPAEQHCGVVVRPFERAEGGRAHQSLSQSGRVGGSLAHVGRQLALKATEIRGVSAAAGWTK